MTTIRLRNRSSRGDAMAFTMIELMIVIAIMALVMAISIPSFYRSLEKDTMRRATKVILDTCTAARTQAIITGRPHDVVILPADGVLQTEAVRSREPTDEELRIEEMERMARETGEPGGDLAWAEEPGALPEGIRIEFVGVNFVPDLQKAGQARVRLYPNGTGDEFTMVIRSDQNEWRQFTMDVATGIIKWEALR